MHVLSQTTLGRLSYASTFNSLVLVMSGYYLGDVPLLEKVRRE